MHEVPTVQGFLDEEGRVRVWCRWCVEWHRHTVADPGPHPLGRGVRIMGHCHAKDSPYLDGYRVLTSARPWRAVRGSVREASRAQARAIERSLITPRIAELRTQIVSMQ
ncbi:hypothetical protein ACFU5O_00835 [Streptomyces sp. NPDC057445]|uniref:hypothetical protein n=1 Tax=Streptomyces sp. NPDC057445 TaxID=3346136 RepID=UPI0036CDB386